MPLLSFSTSSGVQLTASRTVNVLLWDVGTESACSNNGRPASKRRAFPYSRGGQGRCTTDLRPGACDTDALPFPLMVLAASCLYEVVVYLAVKRKSTFVDRRAKDKVIAMGRKARQGKATLFIAAAIVCFAPMIMSGILMAHAGYSPPVARQKEIVAAHPLQVVRQRVDVPFVAVVKAYLMAFP